MSSSEEDEDMYYDAQDGTYADLYFPVPFDRHSTSRPGSSAASRSDSVSPAYPDGRNRTLTSLFGEAPQGRDDEEEKEDIGAAQLALTQEDIAVNMRTFSALSAGLSLGAGDECKSAKPEAMGTDNPAGAEDASGTPPHGALMKSLSATTESSLSISNSSGAQKSTIWSSLKHMFKRQDRSMGPCVQEEVLGAVKIIGPRKRYFSTENQFTGLRLLQSFEGHTGACWVMRLSPEGKYLATAGQDTYINIWLVSQNSETEFETGARDVKDLFVDRIDEESDEGSNSETSASETRKSAQPENSYSDRPRFRIDKVIDDSTPIQTYRDHLADVIDISWSKSNFLLSASIDKTVRLWHVSRPDCLMVCRHPDVVSGVAFHPINDRYFLTGSLDKKLRVWDMDGGTPTMSAWAQTPEMISSVCYYTNGTMAVAGLTNGVVFLFDANNKMKYYTQILSRNRSGKYRLGCKVSGVQHIPADKTPPSLSAPSGISMTAIGNQVNKVEPAQLLVSTNDSRIRLFRLNDFSLRSKLKGHGTTTNLPIRAAISECGEYIISGSEQGHVFIWDKTYGRRKVRSTDAYSNGGDGAAYITTLRTGLSILRNSECESFANDVELTPRGNVKPCKKDSSAAANSNPALCTCFASTGLVKSILSEERIQQLFAEKQKPCDSRGGLRRKSRSFGPYAVGGISDSGIFESSEAGIDKFIAEIAHNIIITADYNGVIRVFVKGI